MFLFLFFFFFKLVNFCVRCEVCVNVNFVANTFLSPLHYLSTFVETQLTTQVWIYFWTSYFVSFIWLPPFSPIPNYFDYYSFMVSPQFSSVQSLSCVWLFATPWTAPHQVSPSITNFQSLLKLMSIESEMSLKGREFEQGLGDGEGQGGLACCSPWGCRVRHDWATELNWGRKDFIWSRSPYNKIKFLNL